MVDRAINDILERLKNLEKSINELNVTDAKVESAIKERLKKIEFDFDKMTDSRTQTNERLSDSLVEVDKLVSVQEEKLSNIIFQLSKLEDRVSKLEQEESKSLDRTRNVIINVLMTLIGAIISYIIGLL